MENMNKLRIYHEIAMYHYFVSPESFPLGNTRLRDSEGMVIYMFPCTQPHLEGSGSEYGEMAGALFSVVSSC